MWNNYSIIVYNMKHVNENRNDSALHRTYTYVSSKILLWMHIYIHRNERFKQIKQFKSN